MQYFFSIVGVGLDVVWQWLCRAFVDAEEDRPSDSRSHYLQIEIRYSLQLHFAARNNKYIGRWSICQYALELQQE
jgi:hypothetical protein